MDKHEVIYLQWLNDSGEWGDYTWCQDRISDEDIKYIRADIAEQRIKELDALIERINRLTHEAITEGFNNKYYINEINALTGKDG